MSAIADAAILAVASPPGHGLRGIIRGSGAGLFEAIAPHVARPDPARPARGLMRARVRIGPLDVPALAMICPAPHSYTGEDALELQLAGNPVLLERIIDGLLASARQRGLDVRRAEPGEFTARAYLNGKMDLIEAEAVAAMIAARSDAELRAARMLSSGALSRLAHELADDLAGALALVEAGIDFTDQEDVVAILPRDLHGRLTDLRDRIDSMLRHAVGMESLEAIPWVVLTGAPNAGKSTLFNALLGRRRAVVSDIAGTTRDVLAEPLAIDTAHGKAEVMLVDLAGADEAESLVSRAMQLAAGEARRRAELILHCVPAGEVRPDVRGREIVVTTKMDLHAASRGGPRAIGLCVSALQGQGLNEVRQLIAARLAARAVSLDADLMVMLARHESALRAARAHLAEAIDVVGAALGSGRDDRHLASPELAAASMRAALDQLAGLAGAITPDDVLGRVFASFCIGK
jgi:tRNA modification GTPase